MKIDKDAHYLTKIRFKTIEEDFNRIHNSKYNYIESIYNGNKVKIICQIHGEFEMVASKHTSTKRGCPKCGNLKKGRELFKRYKNKSALLYYIKIEDVYKIGITVGSVESRFSTELNKGINIDIIDTVTFEDGIKAYNKEQEILKLFEANRITFENDYFRSTECFNINIFNKGKII